MSQIVGPTFEARVMPRKANAAGVARTFVGASAFKYYIHDSVESFRFEMQGCLSETDVAELSGCWRTAKTSLGGRKLILDLRDLSGFDDGGKQWILAMADEGALLLPENLLLDKLSVGEAAAPDSSPVTGFARLIAFLRGSRALSPESSTQAQ